MKIMRPMGAVGIVASAALALAACGSDPASNTGTSTSGAASAATGTANVQCGGKSPLSGEGSTAQKTAMDIFAQQYAKACAGQVVNYNATGSGAGVKQFNAKQVDFGGSDSPISGADADAAKARCAGSPAWNLPMVVGPVAIAYKLDGVTNLTLTGELAAKIFNGQIKTWNDPALVAANPGVNLPAKPIQVFSRSDESGTTDNFQHYLAAAGKGAWTQGTGKAFKGGVGNGASGSNGVASGIRGADGAIGYVESSYVKDGLTAAKLNSGSGGVELTPQNVAKALDAAAFKTPGTNDLAMDLDKIYASNTPGAYPLLLATYEIVCSKGYDADTAKAVKAFLTTAATTAQQPIADKGFVPLPQSLQDKVLTAVNAIS
ncbi:phosphate ABC transporter substrate-binding protein PstS [Amycolatopsis rhizosphaerae]|uniref:Phosphate-binding protein n=1 Tax=Amycolatopsis rhizosphaerae TaxID=2053003 RepID=A0A558DE33_9PSEU|nr:phosphate ABC transporter substrate-binding protein PstS [Amycolatopsis rhizosphaerae]TVT59278.1 phosphate ABC transporter substrate-binding protein PstS [Amycolatopsis rhizosphaerae]